MILDEDLSLAWNWDSYRFLIFRKHAIEAGTDYLLAVDSEGRLDNAETLKELVKLNK